MCTYVTLLTPPNVPRERVLSIIRTNSPFRFDADASASLSRAFADWHIFTGARHPCDCGCLFTVEPDAGASGRADDRLTRRAARLGRERGWTPPRIADWLNQQRALRAHGSERAAANDESELRTWLNLFSALAADLALPVWIVFWHDYAGDVGTEPFELLGHEHHPLANLENTLRRGLKPDIAYEFRRPKRPRTEKCSRRGC